MRYRRVAVLVGTSYGIKVIAAEYREDNSDYIEACRLRPRMRQTLAADSLEAKAFMAVAERFDERRKHTPDRPADATMQDLAASLSDSPLMAAIRPDRSRIALHEACIPYELWFVPALVGAGTASIISVAGVDEYTISTSDSRAMELGLCAISGEGDCPRPRHLSLADSFIDDQIISLMATAGMPVTHLMREPLNLRALKKYGPDVKVPPECRFATSDAFKPGDEVVIQDAQATLHRQTRLLSEPTAVLPIGTKCTITEAKKGDWVGLKCGDAGGYVLPWQATPQPLDRAAFAQKARDQKLPLAQQLNYALRAAALAPKDEAALDLLAETYYRVHTQEYKAARGSEPPSTIECNALRGKLRTGPFASPKECLLAYVRQIPYRWDVVRFDGTRFLRTVRREDELEEYYGSYALTAAEPDKITVTITSRRWLLPGGTLEAALERKSEPAKGTRQLAVYERPLDPASFSLVSSLPRDWREVVADEAGNLEVKTFDCKPQPFTISWDVNRVTKFFFPGGQFASYLPVLSYTLKRKMTMCSTEMLCDREAEVPFEWPSEAFKRAKIAQLESPYNGDGMYLMPAASALALPHAAEDGCSNQTLGVPSPFRNP